MKSNAQRKNIRGIRLRLKCLWRSTGYLSGAGVLRFAQDDTLKNMIIAAGTRQKTPLRPRARGAQDDTLKIEGARC
jgi:hypothetical protein